MVQKKGKKGDHMKIERRTRRRRRRRREIEKERERKAHGVPIDPTAIE